MTDDEERRAEPLDGKRRLPGETRQELPKAMYDEGDVAAAVRYLLLQGDCKNPPTGCGAAPAKISCIKDHPSAIVLRGCDVVEAFADLNIEGEN